MDFKYPDREKDKREEEIMERYGPGRFIIVKCTTKEGLEEDIHDFLVHDWERAGGVYLRKGGPSSYYYCQMVVKKEKEPEPKEEKRYTSSSSANIDDGSFTRVMRYLGPVSEFNKGKKKK